MTESGSKFVEALKVNVKSLGDINDLCKAIKEAGDPYDFITIDTVTALEEMCKPLALKLYQATPAGTNFTGEILSAPQGAGYSFLREAVEMVINKLKARAKNLILVCHAKDAAVDKNEITAKMIDLYGKMFCRS